VIETVDTAPALTPVSHLTCLPKVKRGENGNKNFNDALNQIQ
jgi:hypothetical protein